MARDCNCRRRPWTPYQPNDLDMLADATTRDSTGASARESLDAQKTRPPTRTARCGASNMGGVAQLEEQAMRATACMAKVAGSTPAAALECIAAIIEAEREEEPHA